MQLSLPKKTHRQLVYNALSRCTKAVIRRIGGRQDLTLQIGYVVHNLNDAAVERRCQMFERANAKVIVAGFCRDDALCEMMVARGALHLGQSHDANLIARAGNTLRQAVFHGELKARLAGCDVIVARNLEQLAIARTIAGNRPLIYECLDIHRSLVGTGLMARAVQSVEAALLPRCDMLITSSPAFLRNHFDHRPFSGTALLLENKLFLNEEPDGAATIARTGASGPLTIGWFGMLRCKRTLKFLSGLVQQSENRIEVLVAGKPSAAELPTLAQDIAAVPGMDFAGPYQYSDLPELYARCDFAWSIDWFEEGLNSKWLLPNRLYEAIAFGAIPIALKSVEVGRWLERKSAGLLVDDAAMAAETLLAITPERLAVLHGEIASIDCRDVICSTRECLDLAEAIAALIPR